MLIFLFTFASQLIKQPKASDRFMFSLPCAGSFTPVYFNWILCNSSFYSQDQVTQMQMVENKSVFTPILIAPPQRGDQKMSQQSSCETKTERKLNTIQKCETEDEEYTPGNSQSKKLKKNQQNENRNIIPNIVNQILSYIQKKNKSETTTKKIFEKFNAKQEWSVKRFYLYQTMLKNKISHYVNEQTMRVYMKTGNVDLFVYNEEEQQFYNKISRILIFHFLNTEAETSTLTSKRMDKSKKALHIRVQGQLSDKLLQIFKTA